VTRARHTAAGAALVEVLAAMTLFAIAGSVVAAAAATNLRALRTATTLEYLVAMASRELAIAQAKGAPPTSDDGVVDEPAIGAVRRQLVVTREADDLATLVIAVATAGSSTVTMRTRMLVPQ